MLHVIFREEKKKCVGIKIEVWQTKCLIYKKHWNSHVSMECLHYETQIYISVESVYIYMKTICGECLQ